MQFYCMLALKYYDFELEFEYPFTISKGTKTHQPTLIVSLGLGSLVGYGEAPAIHYYNVTVDKMKDSLERNRQVIERYALTDPQRFWHFLHHLIPGENFLIAALDIAGWDLFARMRRLPLYRLLGLSWNRLPLTDYTLGLGTADEMITKLKQHPWPIYKIKMAHKDDIDLVRALRQHTDAAFRVDANEGWSFDDAKLLLPELQSLGVTLIEQPLPKMEMDAMAELKDSSPLPLFADESCVEESDVQKCISGFHGINIKLTKCGGITPALRMVTEARKSGLKLMMGSMNESTIGSAAVAHLLPLLNEVDVDGPLLLKEDVGTGISYDNGRVIINNNPGLGVQFAGEKFSQAV
jgi:L-alanine-DL-glutamate epimerase-like enolase superfamily enzyme